MLPAEACALFESQAPGNGIALTFLVIFSVFIGVDAVVNGLLLYYSIRK